MKTIKTMKKIALAAGIAAMVLGLAACPASDTPEIVRIEDMPSLWYVYANYFPLGNIIANRHRNDFGNSRRLALLERHFNLLTAENEMKPNELRAGVSYPGNWNFGSADALITWADSNGFGFHGHTLAWHSQSHRWLAQGATPAVAETRLRNHVRHVMDHFGDRVESWDVLNEVIMSGGPGGTNVDIFGNELGVHGVAVGGHGFPLGTMDPGFPWTEPWDWRRSLRADIPDDTNYTNWPAAINRPTNNASCFVRIAFEEARSVNPNLVRYYNDYNLNIPRKRFAVYRMVRDLNGGVVASPGEGLVNAIGMQAHYWLPNVSLPGAPTVRPAWVHPQDVRDSMVRFASLGVYVGITEMDIFAGHGREMDQAIMYARLFSLFRAFSQARRFDEGTAQERSVLRRVSIWGVDDPASWMPERTPLLFDGVGNPKPAFWAVADPDAFLAQHAPLYRFEFADDCFRCFTFDPNTCPHQAGD